MGVMGGSSLLLHVAWTSSAGGGGPQVASLTCQAPQLTCPAGTHSLPMRFLWLEFFTRWLVSKRSPDTRHKAVITRAVKGKVEGAWHPKEYAWKSCDVPSASFYWLEQVPGPAQIKVEGKWTPFLETTSAEKVGRKSWWPSLQQSSTPSQDR